MRVGSLCLILLSVTLAALAQICLKIGMRSGASDPKAVEGMVAAALAAGLNSYSLLGLGLYGVSMVVWMLVLTKVDVSQAYPFVGLGFVVTMILGHQVLGESISSLRLIGTLLVVAGVVCLAKG